MALSRRRDSSLIWPGFVDAVTTLLMVLMFVLTIFTVMQSVLRDTITTKDNELSALTDQVAALSEALGLERKRADGLAAEVGELQASLSSALAAGVAQEGADRGPACRPCRARRRTVGSGWPRSPPSRRRWQRCCRSAIPRLPIWRS